MVLKMRKLPKRNQCNAFWVSESYYLMNIRGSWFRSISWLQIAIRHYPCMGQNLPTQFSICREISASVVSLGYLPRGCRINLSYTQNFYFGWFITKDAVGGHMSRDTGICKSEHPLPPRTKFCQVRGADGSVLGLLSSNVCKVNNTDKCWWLLMRICVQFKSRVFKVPENRTTFSQWYCASLLDCWWYYLNDTKF